MTDIALLGSVIVLSFLGSWHCGVMCGPIACNIKQGKPLASYHIGRLISYLTLALLLFFGQKYFSGFLNTETQILFSIVCGFLLVLFGLQRWGVIGAGFGIKNYGKFHFKIFKGLNRKLSPGTFLMGLFTGFFPCVWLYSFLILSAQMKSVYMAAAVISIFWLSSVPAFALVNGLMSHLISRSKVSYQKISGIILIFAGLLSVLGHWAHIISL